jgi:peptide/nickel transport system permease protein
MADHVKTTSGTSRLGYKINAVGVFGFLVIFLWAMVAIFAPYLIPHPVGEIVDFDYFGPMTSELWLGSDYLGRDVLSRILMGARFTVGISLAAVAIACTYGVVLGMCAAVIGGWFDTLVSRFVDLLMSIPTLIMGLVVLSVLPRTTLILILVMGILDSTRVYRLSRAVAVDINVMDFVTVARVRGESLFYLIGSEILPNIIRPVLADLGVRFVFIVLLLSGLSFLGLGLQPPNADWGALVRENIGGLPFAAPAVIFPSLAIASLTISVNLLIDNLPQKIRDRSEA